MRIVRVVLRRRSCAVAIGLAGLLALSGCDDNPTLTLISADDLFRPAELDFGERTIGATHELTAILSNPQPTELRVTDVRFDPPEDAFAARLENGATLRGAFIGTGEELSIRVLFAPLEPRAHDTTMLVVFGDVAAPLELTARGRERVNAQLVPTPQSINFGSVESRRDVAQTLALVNRGDRSTNLIEVRLGSNGRAARPGVAPFYVARPGSMEPLMNVPFEAGADGEFELHFVPPRPGVYDDTLQFVLRNGETSEVQVRGRGAPIGEMSCVPEYVDFGPLRRGQTRMERVECTSVGGQFTVSNVDFGAATTNRFTLGDLPRNGTILTDGETIEFEVWFTAEGVAREHEIRIDIESEHGVTHSVDVAGEVEPPPPSETALITSVTWDTSMTDIDLHLVRNGAPPFGLLDDCHFRAKNPDWGQQGYTLDDPFLDRDDPSSGGPEQVNLSQAGEQRYDIYVHLFSTDAPVPATASVQVQLSGNVVLDRSRTLGTCGQLWRVAEVMFGAGPPQVNLVDQVTDAAAQGECD